MESIQIRHELNRENMRKGMHFHNRYEIICVVQGEVIFTVGDRRYRAGPNCLLFVNHFENHEVEVVRFPYERFYGLIDPGYLASVIGKPEMESIFRNRPPDFQHVVQLNAADGAKTVGLFLKILREAREKRPFWEMQLAALLRILFIGLYRNYRSHFPAFRDTVSVRTVLAAEKYMEAHYAENLTLETVAGLFFINRDYLSHQFKAVTGYGFHDYLNQIRISKAKDRLFYTDESITQIAMSEGFSDVSHFIRIFKNHEGKTPLQYRKALSRNENTP